MKLQLERKEQDDKTVVAGDAATTLVMTPRIGPEYWRYRVMVSDTQAIVGFPKFSTIGIGFMIEEVDWNTNLPFRKNAHEILDHIWKNRGPGNEGHAFRDTCIAAIQMIQSAVEADQ